MRVIYKFKVSTEFEIEIPREAQALTVQPQGSIPVMWVNLDPDEEVVTRKFKVFGTGEEFSYPALDYVGTFQMSGLVWHLFEIY